MAWAHRKSAEPSDLEAVVGHRSPDARSSFASSAIWFGLKEDFVIAGHRLRTIGILALATTAISCSGATARATIEPHSSTGPAASLAADATVVAAGDIACDPSVNSGAPTRCDQAATAAQILALRPDAVLSLGDNQYERNTAAAYASVFDVSWGQFKSLIHPTIGNHEYLTRNAAGYFDYFGAAAGDPSMGYYSWNIGAWHIVTLNSECSHVGGCNTGSPQEIWLKADLAANPTACTLVTYHEPSWSSGEHGNAFQMATIWGDLVAAHVDVALAGHNHDYERFPALDASGNPDPSGVQEFVVGTGGKNHYPFAVPAMSGEVRDDTAFGVLELKLHPSSYDWRFLPAPGYSFTDAGSNSCR